MGSPDNALIIIDKKSGYEVGRYLVSRVSLPRIPCLPTSYPVSPYLVSRVSLPRIPCLPTSYPDSVFRFSGLPLRLGKVAALAVGDRRAPVHVHEVGYGVNLPSGNNSASF